MQPQQDYKQLLSEVIKKQIVILGPDITLLKARNVQGLVIADDGTVTDIAGDPQQLTQKLIDQFVQLSGEIVRKTMEPLLTMNKAGSVADQPTPTPQPAVQPAVQSPAPIVAQPATPPLPPPQLPTNQQIPTPQTPSPVQNTLAQQANPVQ